MNPPSIPPMLLNEYKKSIPQKLKAIQNLIEQAKQNPLSETLDSLCFAVHKLAGSAGTYGYSEASQLCKELAQKIMNKDKLDLDTFFLNLKKAMN